jgi:SAM-dependent methyltransferase
MNIVTHNEIINIYDKHIAINNNDEYLNRYNPLPFEKNIKNWKWEGKDFSRVISLLEFERYIEKYNFQIKDLLIFNGEGDPELELLQDRIQTMHNFSYEDDTTNYDLHNLTLEKTDYDFVCSHQTFEHIYNPYQCLVNIRKHMKKGGYFYVNVPACNVPHSEPHHFYIGYTPMGLATLAYQAGFKILEIGQWGNKEYMAKNWLRQPVWPEYRYLQNPGVNDFYTPVITWGLFKNE